MVKIKILSARCENFKGFKAFETNFANQTLICGRNGIGKSSVAELIMWVLFGVGNNLSNNPKVRREVNQKPVNDVPVVGELTLDVDGVEIVARKVQKRTFKKDGSYSDDNTYSINGVEKNLKDFNAYFGFSFDDLLMCMNIGAFLSQKPKEMREFLFKLPKDLSAEDIIEKSSDLAGLREFIGKYSIEEIAAMNKASITKLNKEIAGYPARIDEVNRQIANETLAPLFSYGLIKERMAALVTDAMRAEYLKREGYDTQILEFIDMEHTPKNILIRAIYTGNKGKNTEAIRTCEEMLHIDPMLGRLLDQQNEEGEKGV